ncbi:hypothetical protein DSO57_1016256 [Entomophthora muscae]|uniref:Uncharacterized protein n=1 Tax=Entomophthora muscae TaxID=34485 RepID=A0ACC2RW68_9FUNG|nr:hypothetical protein DSO57_1016256 [Entomophthora muscae]
MSNTLFRLQSYSSTNYNCAHRLRNNTQRPTSVMMPEQFYQNKTRSLSSPNSASPLNTPLIKPRHVRSQGPSPFHDHTPPPLKRHEPSPSPEEPPSESTPTQTHHPATLANNIMETITCPLDNPNTPPCTPSPPIPTVIHSQWNPDNPSLLWKKFCISTTQDMTKSQSPNHLSTTNMYPIIKLLS